MAWKQIIGAALGGAVALAAVQVAGGAAKPTDAYRWFDPVVDVQQMIATRFVEEPDLEAMQTSAIEAMVESLNDRYSEYIPASLVSEFEKNTRGEYVGIGAEVRKEDCWLTIASPIEDAPAFKAGVMAGDRITHIEGESTCDLTITECIERLTGEPDTPVTVTVERGGQTFDLTIVRQKVLTRPVKGVHYNGEGWDYWIDPSRKIAYIRLTQFTLASANDLAAAMRALVDDGLRGLVLDLRFNPGGLLGAAIEISDLFLEKGAIVSTKGRTAPEQKAVARKAGTLPDFPMVVLLNRNSASASEVVAGALSDNDRAIVLGERSFGKGSVQEVITLPSGAGHLKLTEKYYYLPSGRNIHRRDDSTEWGVDPTPGFYVPMTDDEVVEMMRLRREAEIIRGPGGAAADAELHDWSDPEWILEHLQDKQLAAAVEAIKAKLDTGEWKKVGEEGDDMSLAAAELQRQARYRERLLRELSRLDKQMSTIASAAGEDAENAAKSAVSVLPEHDDLTGGQIEIFDKDGNRVTTLEITGADLGRWLMDAPVKPRSNTETPGNPGANDQQ